LAIFPDSEGNDFAGIEGLTRLNLSTYPTLSHRRFAHQWEVAAPALTPGPIMPRSARIASASSPHARIGHFASGTPRRSSWFSLMALWKEPWAMSQVGEL